MNKNPGATLQTHLETGIQQMQAGQLGAAEKNFLEGLELSPNDPNALHLLGLTRHLKGDHKDAIDSIRKAISLAPPNDFFLNSLGQVYQAIGEFNEALECFSRAAEINPAVASTHLNLGNALKDLERLDEAIASYRKVLDIQPDYPEAYFNLGVALEKLEKPEEALSSYRQSLAIKPDFPQALCNIGNVLKELGDLEKAVTSFNQFISLAPELVEVETYVNLGDTLRDLGRLEEAVNCYESALVKNPDSAEAYVNLGIALTDLGQLEAATASFVKSHDINPDNCEPFIGLGNVLREQDQLDEAIANYRKAVAIDPIHAGAYGNLGIALRLQNRLEEAVASYRESLRLDPSSAKIHHNLSIALLLLGRLSEGWAEYEWRWRVDGSDEPRVFPQPVWQGDDPKDKIILVWAEQGIGDEVMFASMVPDLVEAGARVVLEIDSRQVALFQRSFPSVTCIAKNNPPSAEACRQDIDFQIPCGDLGKWFRNDFKSFPERSSYLVADGARRNQIRQRYLDGTTDLLVGIAWSSKNKELGERKSLELAEFGPLCDVANIKLVNLQYGNTAQERAAFEKDTGLSLIHDDDIDQMADLDAFAAQVAAMDLVISVSNTTVHFAGALGIPTWVILNTAPLACWMMDRTDSPWYPSLKLFRQKRPGDWAGVIERVVGELEHFPKG